MKIAYHLPSFHTIYAQRTIYHGFKNAFTDLGHEFITYSAEDDFATFFEENQPQIFITGSHFYYQKQLDFKLLKQYRDNTNLVVFVKIDFWKSPLSKARINEAKSLKDDRKTVQMIKEGEMGDVYFHVVEQDDERMNGFEKETGIRFHTIPLAADKIALHPLFDMQFASDISFVGTYLPEKRLFFKECVFPLKYKYNLRIYGQDWTKRERMLGWLQRVGQYFDIPVIRSLQKAKLRLEDEAIIYASSLVSINIHEQYQRDFGGDCNERTFKIPLCSGFEITDYVKCIAKYFKEGEEIVLAINQKDWFDKIDYFIKNPEKRLPIIAAGRMNVLRNHTYHNRVEEIIRLYCEHRKMLTN